MDAHTRTEQLRSTASFIPAYGRCGEGRSLCSVKVQHVPLSRAEENLLLARAYLQRIELARRRLEALKN